MNKYRRILQAERKLEEQNLARLSQQAAQRADQWKAAIAAAEKELVAAHTSAQPFSREHRAAGDQFVAAWLQMFGVPKPPAAKSQQAAPPVNFSRRRITARERAPLF